MDRPSMIKHLDIWMNGELVGNWNVTRNGEHQFKYHPDWLLSAFARPISISMPLRPPDAPYRGPAVEAFFDNLIPDNKEIRKRYQSRFGIPTPMAFDLLAEIGRDCIGALQIIPSGKSPGEIKTIQAHPLEDSEIAASLRNAFAPNALGQWQADDFRISLAGAQEKTAFLKHKGKWHRPLGATPSSHIFKLPMSSRIGKDQIDLSTSVENEWLCSQIVRGFGIPITDCEIADFEDQRVLIVERFDREWALDKTWLVRLPQEDLCQALAVPLGVKYESEGAPGILEIQNFLLGSWRSQSDRRTFFKTQVLFWMLAAVDGHARNFSIFIGRGGRFHLTPLYDVLSAYPILGHGKNKLAPEKAKMAMAVKGKSKHYLWERISRNHWLETAKACGLESEIAEIFSELIENAATVADAVGTNLPAHFPSSVAEPILMGLKKAAQTI